MRYFVLDTLDAANALERVIFQRGAQIAALNGYRVDANGILGMMPDGTLDLSTVRTTRWDEPRQRLDGKWVFLHPQHHQAAREPEWLAFVMQGIEAPAEVENSTWFAAADQDP